MSTLSTTVGGLWLGPDTHANRPATPLGGTLYVCTTHNKIEKYASGAWADWATLGSGGGSTTGAIIAYNAYDPTPLAVYSTTSTTAVDVDATNMAVTFTAPASGKVLMRLSALAHNVAGTNLYSWHLRESTTTVKSQELCTNVSNDFEASMSVTFVISGLTAGSSHTYKWGYSAASSSAAVKVFAGVAAGPAVMEVVAL